ncbi:MAG: NAD(P)/FAD-dependent oxidoreductase [Myxococcota bacterium]
MSGPTLYDVAIAGAGPAGTTAACLLAEAGFSVVVLEREHFPRFHIGESLLPAELPIFERLGLDMSSFPKLYKDGADFLDERQGKFHRFSFSEGLEGTRPHSYQVERAKFDLALLRRAEALGAEVRQGVRVLSAELDEAPYTLRTSEGDVRARYVLDATGRDRLLSKQHKSYQRIEGLGLAAVWAHFDKLSDEARAQLEDEGKGNITIMMVPNGWAWVIPLHGGRVSVGFVSAKKGVVSDDWFESEYAYSPFLQRITEGAERSELVTAGDYSYTNPLPHGPGFGCIGDARGFLDPVFSSGVALAMASASKLADLLIPALERGEESDADLLLPLKEHMDHAYAVFGSVLRSFYHTNLVDNLFFYDDPDPELKAGLISILAGDLWRDDNRFQAMMLRRAARRRSA